MTTRSCGEAQRTEYTDVLLLSGKISAHVFSGELAILLAHALLSTKKGKRTMQHLGKIFILLMFSFSLMGCLLDEGHQTSAMMEDVGELPEALGSDPSIEDTEGGAGVSAEDVESSDDSDEPGRLGGDNGRGGDPSEARKALQMRQMRLPDAAAPPLLRAEVVVYNEPDVVTVTIPDPSVRTKTGMTTDTTTGSTTDGEVQPLVVGDNSAAHCSVNFPPCQFNIHKTATRTITPPGGSSGQLKSEGTAFVDVYTIFGCCFTQADYYNTNSYFQWGGTNPWNATSIKHSDVWDIDYLAVSWSFGGTPSGTINLGSGRLLYETTVSNTWKVSHSVQHVYIKVSGGRVTKVKYEAHGSYGFGSTFYTTDAYSSVALP